jgi:hypothetical protein
MLPFAIMTPKADEETTITVRLPSSLKTAVEDYSLPRGMTLAGIVRRALEDFLVPPQKVYELPGFSKEFNDFLENKDLKTRNGTALLLVEDGGNRSLYRGHIDFNLSASSLVALRVGPGASPWILLRKHIAGWHTGPDQEKLIQTLVDRGWFLVTYAPR